jgi:UDP-GlcNAc:undecaprenyl-phosphate GlcNAc-1-phosphate transferase
VAILLLVLPALCAAAISFAATPLIRRFALRFGAVDMPGPRKMHLQPTPRLGGLAVVLAVMAVLGLGRIVPVPGLPLLELPLFLALALGVVPVLFVSIWDDFRPLGILPRFAAHFAGAAIALLFGIRLGSHIHVFALDVSIGAFAVPLSLLWIVGVTNAFNIVDGLDGLSAGLALIAALSLVGVSLMTGCFAMALASTILAGALMGFLPFNLFPARVFLGDSGATALGFWLACLALGGGSTLSAGMAILVPILVIGVPVAETLVSMSRRLVRRLEKRGAGVFGADGEHIHHRLISRGLTHRRAVMLLYGAGLLAAGAGLVSVFLTVQAAAVLLLTLIAAAVIGITRLNYDEFALVRRGVILRLDAVPVLKRALFPVFFDLGLVVAALYGGVVLTAHVPGSIAPRIPALLEVLPIVTIATFWLAGMYRGPWRHETATGLLRAGAAVAAATFGGALVCRIAIPNPPPAAFFAVDALILLALVNISRASIPLLAHFRRPPSGSPGEEQPALSAKTLTDAPSPLPVSSQ